MKARVQPGSIRDVGLATWLLARVSGFVTGTRPPRVFLVLGKHRQLFRGWLHFSGRLMLGGVLGRRETELVILRVAHLRGSHYEFEQHVRLGTRAGLRTHDVDRVIAGADAPGWSRREQTLLRAVDQLHIEQDLDETNWRALREVCTEREAIELCLLVGHYEMLATTISALRISPDEPRRQTRPLPDFPVDGSR